MKVALAVARFITPVQIGRVRSLAVIVNSVLLAAFVAALWPQAHHDTEPTSSGIHLAAAGDGVPAEPRRERGPRDACSASGGSSVASPADASCVVAGVHAGDIRFAADGRAGLRRVLRRLRIPRMNDEPPGQRA